MTSPFCENELDFVNDHPRKDFVFRAFWERDECHSLLEKLRVEADELRVRAEEFRARAEELRAETGRDGSVGGDEMSAPERAPGSGFAVSYDGEEDSAGFGDNDEQVRFLIGRLWGGRWEGVLRRAPWSVGVGWLAGWLLEGVWRECAY